jgi:hypothetical protein
LAAANYACVWPGLANDGPLSWAPGLDAVENGHGAEGDGGATRDGGSDAAGERPHDG